VLLGAVIAAYAPSLQMRVVGRPHLPGFRFELALVCAFVARRQPMQMALGAAFADQFAGMPEPARNMIGLRLQRLEP
jgi:hypothetical protein